MPYHALISTVNSHSGSLSTMTRVCESTTQATSSEFSAQQLEEAARVLRAFNDPANQPAGMFQDRHWHIDACLVPFHPHHVESGLKIFDRQASRSGGFFTGNAFTNTQTSAYIRSFLEVECNGQAYAAGALRQADLKTFTDVRGPQPGLESFLDVLKKPENAKRDLIGYKVFHTQSKPDTHGKPVARIHGWVITDTVGNLVRSIVPEAFYQPTARVMDRAIAAFSHETVGVRVPLLRIDGGSLTFAAPALLSHLRLSQDEEMPAAVSSPASGRKPN